MKALFFRIIEIVFFTCLAAGLLGASPVSVSLEKDRFTMDEQITLSVTVKNGNGQEEIRLPAETNNFQIHTAGTSQQYSNINGQEMSSVVYNYVIVPLKPGKTQISSLIVIKDGSSYTMDPISIEILPSNAASNLNTDPQNSSGDLSVREGLKVELKLDKTELFVDEPVVMRFIIYRRGDIRLGRDTGYDMPKSPDFISEKEEQVKDVVSINGVKYEKIEVRTVLYPSRPGEFEIGPGFLTGKRLTPVKRQQTRRHPGLRGIPDMDSFFDDAFSDDPFSMFGSRVEATPFKLKSDTVKVKVNPLPENGKPSGFSGTVGNYRLGVDYSSLQGLKKGDSITVTMTVSGAGHLTTISEPQLKNMEGFRAFESEVSLIPFSDSLSIGGKKVFKKILIPEKAGTVRLPDVELKVFDTMSRQYVTLKKEGPSITVADVKDSEFTQKVFDAENTLPKTGVKLKILHQDIIYIHTSPEILKPSKKPLPLTSFLFWLFFGPVFLLGGWIFQTQIRVRFEDPAYVRSRKAISLFKNAVKKASVYDEKNFKTACSVLSQAVSGYYSDKLNLPRGTWTVPEIRKTLEMRGVPEDLNKQLIRHLDTLDMCQYGLNPMKKAEWKPFLDELEKTVKALETLKIWN